MVRKVSVGKELNTTGLTTLYTVPSGYRASWNLLYLINNTASAKHFTVAWRDTDGSVIAHVFDTYPVSASNYIMFDSGAWVNMEEGQYVTVECLDSGCNADVIASFEVERNNA